MTCASRIFSIALLFTIATAALCAAQKIEPAQMPRTIYVQDFEAHTGDPDGDDTPRRGILSILRGARSSWKAVTSAGSLSGAIADRFAAQGFASKRISRESPLPKEGWLVTGIFYAINSQTGMIRMPAFISGQPDPVNTEITVSVADLASNPDAPFIVFGQAEALRGQGPPAGWNPYVIAAKFVVDKVESSADINKLAKQIVDTILANKSVVIEKAAVQQPPDDPS
jgi:hypothetical protein